MKKLFIALVFALATAPLGASATAGQLAAAPTAQDVNQVTLKQVVEVEGSVIHLGDLFTNAGDLSDRGVAYAPKPGGQAIFDAKWLFRVARAYQLNWRPMSRDVKVRVERKSQVISREEIEDEILAALIDKGAAPDMKVELGNRMLRLHVPWDALAALEIEDIVYESRTQRFAAIISAPAGDPAAQRMRVTGRLHRIANIPVLARRMVSNEIITLRDITWIKVRANRLQPDVVLDETGLIGMAPKRTMRAGFPVRTSSIRRPILVEKGSLVMIVLKAPQMQLTAQGKALEHGSEGDTIRVTNTQSSTVVEGEVTAAGRITVSLTTLLALNQ